MAVAYEWHNYGKSTIGNRTDIERVPIDNLQAFYQKFYQPDNAVLVVAGKFDEKKALELYREVLRRHRPGRTASSTTTYTEEPAQDGERFVTLRRVGDVGLVGVLYHVPAGSHAEFPAVEILADILDSEPSGRLYKALVETKKASSVIGQRSSATTIRARSRSWPKSTPRTGRRWRRSATRCSRCSSEVGGDRVSRRRRSIEPGSSILKERELAAARSQPDRHRAQRVGRAGRLAALFPQPRPHREGHARAGQGGRREVSDGQQPHGRLLRPDRPSPSGPRSPPTPDVAKLVEDYTGREIEARAASRSTSRRLAIEARRPAARADRRHQARLPAQEDPGRVRPASADPALRQRREPQGLRPRQPAFLPELMTRGTEDLTRQQIQDALDKNFARLGGGMGGRC